MRLSWQLPPPAGKITPVPHTDPVTDLTIEVDPAEAGLDKERLKRIDAHFARYVDDGRLAGLAAHDRPARPPGARGPVRVT